MLETIERMAAVTHAAAVGAAERRQAARRRGAQHLSVLAGVHGVVRAPLHPAQRAPRRRLLRHDAGAHPADQGGGARRWRRPVAVRAGEPAPTRASAAPAIAAPPVPREQKSRLAHALARGTFVVAVELLPPRGYQTRPGRSSGRAR